MSDNEIIDQLFFDEKYDEKSENSDTYLYEEEETKNRQQNLTTDNDTDTESESHNSNTKKKKKNKKKKKKKANTVNAIQQYNLKSNEVPIDFETPRLYLFVGKSNSGKTHTMKHIVRKLWKEKRFKFGIVFSSTVDFQTGGQYYEWIKQKNGSEGHLVSDDPTTDRGKIVFTKYLEYLKKLAKENKKVGVPNFMIIDDQAGKIKHMDPDFLRFLCIYRHLGTTLFVCIQEIHRISPVCRLQASYIFVWRNNNLDNIKCIERQFSAYLYKLGRSFVDILDEATSVPFQCLLINATNTPGKKIEEFTTYLAPEKDEKNIIIEF